MFQGQPMGAKRALVACWTLNPRMHYYGTALQYLLMRWPKRIVFDAATGLTCLDTLLNAHQIDRKQAQTDVLVQAPSELQVPLLNKVPAFE